MCDGDNTPVILGMSRAMKCGVLSRDSAYFLHDVPQGYVPIHRVQIKGSSLTMQVCALAQLTTPVRFYNQMLGVQQRLTCFCYLRHEAPAGVTVECTGRGAHRSRDGDSPVPEASGGEWIDV